jgi:hypothetical protein
LANDTRLPEQSEEAAASLRCRATSLIGRHRQQRPDRGAIDPVTKPRLQLEVLARRSKESNEGVDSWDGPTHLDPGN